MAQSEWLITSAAACLLAGIGLWLVNADLPSRQATFNEAAFGLAVLVLGLLAARAFTTANPAVVARQLRFLVGVVLIAIAAILILRGRLDFGIMLAALGWGFLMGRGVLPWGQGGWGGAGTRTSGQGSRIETEHLDMELDHDTGEIRGQVLKGRFAGEDIETLTPAEIALLWQDYSFSDPTSAQLLEAYLEQRHPSWCPRTWRCRPDAGPRCP